MPVEFLHHVNLRVPAAQMDELRDFYCKVLGLVEGWRPPFASSGYWLYAGDAPVVHLVAMGAEEAASAGRFGRSVIDHVAFRCADKGSMAAHLRALGIEYSVSIVPEVGDVQFLLRDPLGTGVELGFSSL